MSTLQINLIDEEADIDGAVFNSLMYLTDFIRIGPETLLSSLTDFQRYVKFVHVVPAWEHERLDSSSWPHVAYPSGNAAFSWQARCVPEIIHLPATTSWCTSRSDQAPNHAFKRMRSRGLTPGALN